MLDFSASQRSGRAQRAGVVTPDHTIRTKNWPLVLPRAGSRQARRFRARRPRSGRRTFVAHYRSYFARHNERAGGGKRELDPLPRVVLVPGLGLFGLGRTKHDAVIAADIAEEWIAVVGDAEAHRPLRVDLRSRHVRLRILVARTGEARHAQGAAARRPDRRDHRRRRRHRRRDREGLCRGRRRGRAARPRTSPPRATQAKAIGADRAARLPAT